MSVLGGMMVAACTSLPAWAEDTVKIGVLHSLTGTMAISETSLKDVVLMAVERSTPRAA